MKTRAFVAALLVGLTSAGCQGSATTSVVGPPSGDIIIASDLPVGAPEASDALAAQQAIALAIKEHPRVGRFKLAYWSLDDAVAGNYQPETGVQNVSWMVDVPRVLGVIGPWVSDITALTIPVANRNDLVMVNPASTRPCLTHPGPGCPYDAASLRPSGHVNFFRIPAPDPRQGLAMARYVVANLGITRVAVINEDGPGGTLTVDMFRQELRRLGGDVVDREDVKPGTLDFQGFLKSARDHGAQAVYAMGGAVEDGICVVRAQMPPDMFLLGSDELAPGLPDCLTQTAKHAFSMLATKPDVDIQGSTDPKAKREVEAFHKAYPRAPILDYTFSAYDCTGLLIAAIEDAISDANGGIPRRAQVLAAVARINYPGLTGTYSFDANGDARAPLMEIYDVENGAWVNKGRIDASAAPPG